MVGIPKAQGSDNRPLEERVQALEKLLHTHLGSAGSLPTAQVPHPIPATHVHSQYLAIADIDDTPVDGVVNAPISSNWAFDHVAAADPHTGYATDGDLTTHAGAADPHTVYLKETDFDDINFLVGTATGHTGAEIVVGTTPGGELGGTWAAPTVDATHSGSAHNLIMISGSASVAQQNATTKTSLKSGGITIPANTLGTTKKFIYELTGAVQNNGTRTLQWYIDWNGANVIDDTILLANSANYRYWTLRIEVFSTTAADATRIIASWMFSSSALPTGVAGTTFGDLDGTDVYRRTIGHASTTGTTSDRVVEVFTNWVTSAASADFYSFSHHGYYIG